MKSIALAATMALVLGGCASTRSGGGEDHAAHHPQEAGAAAPSPERVDMHMKTMQDMHQKMMAAKTPEERQALMAEHMKAMEGGMTMMCEMGARGGMGMQGSAGSKDMMKRCMSMKDTTMQMMMDRESGRPPATK